VNKVLLKYISALVGFLGKIEKTEKVVFVFCLEPFKIGDKIASPRTKILGHILFIKIEVLLGRTPKKFMNLCRKCVATQNWIAEKFDVGAKGFDYVKTVLTL